MEDPNVNHQVHVNAEGHVLALHHLLNSVEAASQMNHEEVQRQTIGAQDQGVIEQLQQIAEQKSNGETSIQTLGDFSEPLKKKPRKGGRKKKSEGDGTVIIDGQTIIASGEQVDGNLTPTPKKACLMCGAPIALRNYCWKCYKRKQRSASKMDPQHESNLAAMAAMASINDQNATLNALMGNPMGSTTPPIVTSPGLGMSPMTDPNMMSKRGRRHKPVTDLADVDRKLRRVQEKVTEEMEKWVGSKDEAQQLIDEWAKKRVKQINRTFSGVTNNLNNSQNAGASNSNSNASGDESVEPLAFNPVEPEVHVKIGKAYCEFVRNLPVNSPFRKPLLASILKHSNEELSIHEFERAVPVTHTTLMQCKKMTDEENLFIVIKTLPSQIKDRLKKSPRDDNDTSVATIMEEAARLEGEQNSNENSLNSVASLANAAESATAEQLLQMVPQALSNELAQLQGLQQHFQNTSSLHTLVHDMQPGNIISSNVNGSPQQ